MHGLKRMTSVGLVVVAALAGTITTTSAATTTTRWVDNDGHAGPNGCQGTATAARKIQKAVDHSNQADVVIVCPGTYVEQVRIQGDRDGLTLKSSTPFGASIKAPTTLDDLLYTNFSYIVGVVRTDDVTIEGFKVITRTHSPCDTVQAAIAGIGSRGFVVRGNRLLAPGTSTGGCHQGNGLLLQDGVTPTDTRTSSARFTSNEVRDVRGSSIVVTGIYSQSTFTIAGNSVRAYFGAPPARTSILSARRAVTGRPKLSAMRPLGNVIDGSFGIALGGRVKGAVTGNVIQGSSDAPLGGPTFQVGIWVIGSNGSPANSNGPIDIRDNLIRRVAAGILLIDAAQVTARRNAVSNVMDGVRLLGAQDNIVRRNNVSSKAAGIGVDSGSTGNAIRDNAFSGNGGTCEDSSTGGGSHGTANTWTGNTATVGDNPNGICPTS